MNKKLAYTLLILIQLNIHQGGISNQVVDGYIPIVHHSPIFMILKRIIGYTLKQDMKFLFFTSIAVRNGLGLTVMNDSLYK